MATGSLSQHDITTSEEAVQIAELLRTNCRQWKLLDLLLMFCQTALVGLAILFSSFVIDHWAYLIVQGGSLGSVGRWFYFLSLFVIYPPVSLYLISRSLKGRINPLFVAQQIEELSPEIKNSISNFWQIKSESHIHPSIAKSMAQRAYLDLNDGRTVDGVDTTKTSLWGYSSLGFLAITAIYFAIMPNPSIQTMHRIFIPWDNVQRPSEILIESVQPGAATIHYGSTLQITAVISGADNDTPVYLVTDSTDGSTGEQKQIMELENNQYQLLLNQEPLGIQRSFTYWIEAGHPEGRTAISKQYYVTVKPAAAIRVTQVEYEFPVYTDLPNVLNSRQFNVEAIEGTTIKVTALANADIDSAWIELTTDSGSAEKRTMTLQDDRTCETIFELRVNANQIPAYLGYQVFFRSKAGETNPETIEHSITTLTDLMPVIEFTKPARRELRQGPLNLPVNQSVQLAWTAHDPDYQLSSVCMVVAGQNHDDIRVELLKPNQQNKEQREFSTIFTPAKHNLKAGTRVTVYGEAADNRKTSSNPQPNRAQSELFIIHLTDPVESTDMEAPDDMAAQPDMPDSPSDKMEDGPPEETPEEGASPDSGEGSESGEGMTGGASEKTEEDGDAGTENNGTGGQGETSEDPNNSTGENAPANEGGKPGNPTESNSEDGMADSENRDDANDMESQAGGEGSASTNNSEVNQTENNMGQASEESGAGENQDNSDSVNGSPTGESGDDGNTNNNPDNEGSSKPDDQHDGDIFEKLLDRLRDNQSKTQPMENGSSEQEPMMGNNDGVNNQSPKENSGNRTEDQPSAEDGNGQANTQKDSTTPNTGDPSNPASQDKGNATDPNAEGMATKDPMKTPRAGNAGAEGEQVEDDGGSDTMGQSDGPQMSDSSSSDSTEPNGQNTSETAGSEDSMSAPGDTEGSAGSQANPQSGTGQQDANPTDELGLPEEVRDTEQARLDYARKATDLALKYLRDQQDNPSNELLEDLGITPEQLREMVSRYEQLKQDETQTGKQTLNDTLKSLGLRPSSQTKARQVKTNRRDVKGVSGGGALSGLPPHLQQRFKSFRTGTTVSDE